MSEKVVQIKKTNAAKQIVYGEVYAPFIPDSQGDYATPEEIERIAHSFIAKGNGGNIDVEHDLIKSGSYAVESFIARKGDPDFTPGAWVLGIHIPDAGVWKSVQDGKLNGFSMFGTGKRVEKTLEIEIPDDGILKGECHSAEDHTHEYLIKFDADGKFLGGETTEVNGHKHKITKGTATEVAEKHSHRYSFAAELLAKMAH